MSGLVQLIYTSQAVEPFSGEQLSKLLEAARANNKALGVSGMLVYEDRIFLQALEGDESVVMPLYEKIGQDKRHEQLILLSKRAVEERAFSEWTMGFFNADVTALESLSGFYDFFGRNFSLFDFARNADLAHKILLRFKDGAWHRHVDS